MSDSDLSSPWLSQRRVRPLDLVPLGTKAPAIMGGWWLKMATGWKWNGPGGNGGTFPRPGGDWDGHVILPEGADARNELRRLYSAYVNLLEIGRDRIVSAGGSCDPVDVMEAGDPALVRVRAFLFASAEGA